MKLYSDNFNLIDVLTKTQQFGYAFSNDSNKETTELLLNEARLLTFEYGDHVNYLINKNKPYQVTQSHERHYKMVNDISCPFTNKVCKLWEKEIANTINIFPDLHGWTPKELGHQRYRDNKDYISPHRDRWSDRQLSITYTLFGEAVVKIYEPLTDPIDYNHINQIDEFKTIQGTIMFLRTPGFGNGVQVIHEVMPPTIFPRYILNLRTRDTLLPQPSKIKNQ